MELSFPSLFFDELKLVPNNKDIFNVEHIQQRKIKFEPPRHKRDIVHYANWQRYGHTEITDISNRGVPNAPVTT
jgi:hypothetical protein